jgi:hypothetical protein
VELGLILSAPLTTVEAPSLAEHENLVSLIPQIRTAEEIRLESRKGLSDSELFNAYYQATFHTEPKQELKELFLSTLGEIDKEGGENA